MTAILTPDKVLGEISGWEGATWEELHGGLTNRTYRVANNGRVGVLKLDACRREEPFNTRCAEACVQSTAANAGLAPQVILADDCIYFTEYVEGEVWARRCLDKEGNLELIAATLKRLHALPLTGRSFDARVAARRYVERIDGLDPVLVELCTNITGSMRLPQHLCCCHNDLVAENLITTPELMFLDWEYACDNDPFFDLATVIEHHGLSDAQTARLLDAYFDDDGERWRVNLERQRKLYLALLCLWLAARPDGDSVELSRVAERLTTSCS